MLYEDITTGAIVVGYSLDTGNALTASQAESIRDKLAELARQHGVDVKMFVPGDSSTDHSGDPDMELYTPELHFGVIAVAASPDETPCPVSLEQIRAAQERIEAVDASFWKALSEAVDVIPSGFGEGPPSVFLMCWGPLPCVNLAYGVKHPSDEKDSARYEFFSCQDMDQCWRPEGVDGILVPAFCEDDGGAGVEFTDVVRISITESLLAELPAKVPNLHGPAIHLTVRYD